MTLTIPLFALRKGYTSGVEYAVFNLLKGLHENDAAFEVVHSADRATLSPVIVDWLAQTRVAHRHFPALGKRMAGRFAEETLFGLTAKADQVLFPNYFVPPATPRIGQVSTVLYDVQHKVYPEFFTARKRAWLDATIGHAFAHADRILYISAYEAEQARRFYGDRHADKFRVVHLAIDWTRFDGAAEISETVGDRPYILSVAQHYPHKRLDMLIRAFGRMALRAPDIDLVLVGRRRGGLVEDALVEVGVDIAARVRFTGFVSDAALGALYRNARMFALPSLYEGFGMPAVEALSFGRPALLTDCTAVPEATLGYGTYLPESAGTDDWADALAQMVANPPVVTAVQAETLRATYAPAAIARRVVAALN